MWGGVYKVSHCWPLTRAGIAGGGGLGKPQFMSRDAHFWVKIGFKFQSLCKISNISTSDAFDVSLADVWRKLYWNPVTRASLYSFRFSTHLFRTCRSSDILFTVIIHLRRQSIANCGWSFTCSESSHLTADRCSSPQYRRGLNRWELRR